MAGCIGFIACCVLPVAAMSDTGGPHADFSGMATSLLPAVVNISTTAMSAPDADDQQPQMPDFPPGSPWGELFKHFMNPQGEDAKPEKVRALGSGFIIDPSGLVVTNNHVVADATSITVTLQDGSHAKATVVGKDKLTDLALLRIHPPHKLPYVAFGDSNKVRVGDWVMAVGNPFGLGGTVTAGILSARNRAINDGGPYDNFLQTDASINKGNSGGPLFNRAGEVVGINSAIFSPSGGSIGIGFAIPSELVKHVVAQFEAYGKAKRGWIGVRLANVNDDMASALSVPDKAANPALGAIVGALVAGGPADRAGLKPGDVVLAVNGEPIRDSLQLQRAIGDAEVGRAANLEILRDARPRSIAVMVKEQVVPKAAAAAVQPASAPAAPPSVTLLGMSVASPPVTLRHQLGLDDGDSTVVLGIARNSPASGAGLLAGDRILEADGDDVRGPADLVAKVDHARKAGTKSLLILVDRGGAFHFVDLQLAKVG